MSFQRKFNDFLQLLLLACFDMKLFYFLQEDQKYAFIYALLIFLSLFAATVHIESHTRHDFTFLIIFAVFGMFYSNAVIKIFYNVDKVDNLDLEGLS